MTLGWGIVGLGRQADEYLAPAMHQARHTRLIAVCSADLARAQAFARRHRVPHAYATYQALLCDPAVQAVCVSSPNDEHARHVIAAARAGKHVLCEKPMALSWAQGRSMIQACTRHKVRLGIGYHLRHHPLHQRASQLCRSRVIGTVTLLQVHWSVGRPGMTRVPPYPGHLGWRDEVKRAGGGALMARGVHLFDMIRHLTGQEIVEVCAMMEQPRLQAVDTLVVGLCQLSGGAFATLVTSRRIPYALNDVVIYGSAGRLILRDALTTDGSGTLLLEGRSTSRWRGIRQNLYQCEIERFCRTVTTGQPFAASGEDGLRAIAVTEAFTRSARRRRVVRVRL